MRASASVASALGSPSRYMNGVTVPARSTEFQRSFVAMRYYFGARGEALTCALGALALQPAAADALRGLASEQKAERARVLAVELGRLAAALDERSLAR